MKDSLPSAEAGRLDNTPKREVIQTRITTGSAAHNIQYTRKTQNG